jgi:hypothetical protein
VLTAETVLVCALAMLPRRLDLLPPIVLVDTRPAYASPTAEGWVLAHDRRIHLLTTSRAFQRAMRAADRCGDVQALKKIASVVVHEDWHVRNGPDESGAYEAQLTMLTALHSGPGTPLFTEVWLARRHATSAAGSPRPAPSPRATKR